jgi:hypothetical protein
MPLRHYNWLNCDTQRYFLLYAECAVMLGDIMLGEVKVRVVLGLCAQCRYAEIAWDGI